MTHSSLGSQNFAEHFIGLLKNRGTSGTTGNSISKSFNFNDKSGTEICSEVVPVVFDRYHQVRSNGTAFVTEDQQLILPVTTVTSGTAIFAGGTAEAKADTGPTEWLAIAAELKARTCPDWWSSDVWKALLADAESFLRRWGSVAYSLGWTPLDLFGVHPRSPAGRYDLMGLIPLIQGAVVTALTADTAALHRTSGARLTYRRHSRHGAVLLSDLLKAQSHSPATNGSAA